MRGRTGRQGPDDDVPPARTIVLCPGCGRRNRVPAERLAHLHTLRCAACREPLAPAGPGAGDPGPAGPGAGDPGPADTGRRGRGRAPRHDGEVSGESGEEGGRQGPGRGPWARVRAAPGWPAWAPPRPGAPRPRPDGEGGRAEVKDEVTTVVPCAGCGRRNRVPAERLGHLHTLRCAACREPLAPPPP